MYDRVKETTVMMQPKEKFCFADNIGTPSMGRKIQLHAKLIEKPTAMFAHASAIEPSLV